MTKMGSYIRKMRENLDYPQEVLAEALRVSRPTYAQIEKGDRELMISEAKTLAHIFGVSVQDLLDQKGPSHAVTLETEKPKTAEKLEIRVTQKNLDKFKQVLLYVLDKVGGKPNVGETVLHKLLYFIDFDYYEKFEENLMGATYIKNHHGPTALELKAIVEDMEKNQELETVKSSYFKYEQKKFLPLKKPNLNLLTAQELHHIDDVLSRLADKNAREMEDYSHEDIPWKAAADGKPISYESVFYRDKHYSMKNHADKL